MNNLGSQCRSLLRFSIKTRLEGTLDLLKLPKYILFPVRDFILRGFKILQMVTAALKLKDFFSLEEKL